ncbi:hypothetical protein V499_01561 [Pseudogymnoascus sp. VKM F-103]|nr:hypothetical protein V499_01561 [Pseudogymnoascus sp. VKM F-103]
MSTLLCNMEIDRQGDLCETCRNIDLDALLKEDGMYQAQPVLYQPLAPISVKASSSCPLCEFFLSMLKDEERAGADAVYLFMVTRSQPATEETWKNHDERRKQRCFFVQTSPDLTGPGPEWQEWETPERPRCDLERPRVNYSKLPDMPVLIEHERVDYEPLRGWCKKIRALETARTAKLQGLKGVDDGALPVNVIDCHTREIVPVQAPCEYFTLSYVWGATTVAPESSSGSSLPSRLPTTVEDAITVVKQLGYRYLWVDRYCLDQSNKAQFQTQLNQMGDIYRNGVAGIIAAAGGDSDYGLPGVSTRARTRQPRVRIGNYVLWSNMMDPRTVVRRSKWMTRAWTYQEGIFTANWFAFTDEQVFFQKSDNSTMANRERLWKVSCEMFPNGGMGVEANCPLLRMSDNNMWSSEGYIHLKLEAYTSRSITYPSDAVNGMLGLLKRCGNGPYPMNHYFGVPILGPLLNHRISMARDTTRSWTLTKAFVVGLCWTSENTGLRRLEFPSWSWAGWKTSYARPSHGTLCDGITLADDFKLSVQTKQGLVDWEVMCYAKSWGLDEDTSLLPRELYIEAPTIMVTICQDPRSMASDWASAATGHASILKSMGWCAMFSDADCDVLVKVNLVDAETVSKLTTLGSMTLKGVILRREFIFALLVLETNEAAIRVGSLTLVDYFVRWKTDVQHHNVQASEYWNNSGRISHMHCPECKQRAFQSIIPSETTEVTRVQ